MPPPLTHKSLLPLLSLTLPVLSAPFPQGAGLAAPSAQEPTADDLRGGPELLGYNPDNYLSDEDTTSIQFELAPGQTLDADLGISFDFENVEHPQPLRGELGGTDPGPSGLSSSLSFVTELTIHRKRVVRQN